ncbi:DHA2 family efflux MFS transporter permease subunit [Sporomusa aerivorans]|uniref:DHA2 family efflux MFS transporter permease subunit n=1 Tax=Sporomusa aerivorans TaxID=204936 RepID=UPI00352AB848
MSQPNQQVKTGVLLFILILGAFLSLLNQTILNVALPDLMKQFEISATNVQWLSTGFMLVNGIIVPATAYFMKRFTTRQLFISSMVLLLVGTFINAIAPNFAFLLTGRLIQAAGTGIIMPLLMVVILAIFPEDGRGTAMGMIGLVMIVAPAIAPTLAGFIIEHFSWRWLFIGMLPLVVIIIGLSARYLVNVSEPSKPRLDIKSIILSTVGFGGILYGFGSAGDKGWGSTVVLSCLLVGTICLVLFIWRQLTSTNPLMNLEVFKSRMFTMTTIILVLSTIVMYADIILMPIYLQETMSYTVLQTGLLLLPGALISALMSPIAGRLFDKFGAKPLALAGLFFTIIAIGGVTNLSETTSYDYLMIRTIVLRIGMSLIIMPVNTGGLNALSRHLNADGTAASNTVRQVAGSIGTALPVTIMTIRTQDHSDELLQFGDILSPDEISRQASILGINDAYIFIVFKLLQHFLQLS